MHDLAKLFEITRDCKSYQEVIDTIGVEYLKTFIDMGATEPMKGVVFSICARLGISFNDDDPLWSSYHRTEEEQRLIDEQVRKSHKHRLALQNWLDGNTDHLDIS